MNKAAHVKVVKALAFRCDFLIRSVFGMCTGSQEKKPWKSLENKVEPEGLRTRMTVQARRTKVEPED